MIVLILLHFATVRFKNLIKKTMSKLSEHQSKAINRIYYSIIHQTFNDSL